jgi:hypothetical protein
VMVGGSGTLVSTVKVLLAGVASTFQAVSMALMAMVCDPLVRPE